ncbi:MAG TPA: hypothetical protein P5567_10250 [Kiritimatiellia bacterium]|nr:hypothetical protein [Kiritimatiellia bacterium]HRZ12819.1 hypothetical protein [Kiritimatiellia bacterium]HSA18229.1 hypothetical protein [Kiritimatiellia bacterium]
METLRLHMTFGLIQQIRLVHALAESSHPVSIPASEEPKFDALRARFGFRFAPPDAPGVDVTRFVRCEHRAPATFIGRIERPVIFPRAMADYCRSLWPARRAHRFSFQGLVFGARRTLLQKWIKANLGGRTPRLPDAEGAVARWRNKLFRAAGLDPTRKQRIGDLLLWESSRGRRFPVKAWDEEYVGALAASEFVLCPDGEHVWTYRLFESALCGAIPIVERACPAYAGFRFRSFEDRAGRLTWSAEDAEHNYRLCAERLTIAQPTLDAEIAHILEQAR